MKLSAKPSDLYVSRMFSISPWSCCRIRATSSPLLAKSAAVEHRLCSVCKTFSGNGSSSLISLHLDCSMIIVDFSYKRMRTCFQKSLVAICTCLLNSLNLFSATPVIAVLSSSPLNFAALAFFSCRAKTSSCSECSAQLSKSPREL